MRKEKRWLVEKMVKEEYYEKESIIVKRMAGIHIFLQRRRCEALQRQITYIHGIILSGIRLESINTVLRPTFELAVRDDIIRRNPVDGAYAEVKKRNGGARKSRRALTVEQQREFIDYVAKNPFFFHWYPFFVFLLGTGCRIGEAIGIRWDDVDMKKRTININHSLTYYTRSDNSFKCEFRVSEPKTEAGIRTIPMMGPVYEVLKSEY